MKAAIIGNGYWSKILQQYIPRYFDIKYIANSKFDLNKIWKDRSVEVVFIATPIDTHYSIAIDALDNNKHVFIEKPLTTNYSEALILSHTAKRKNLILFTDLTYTFSDELNSILDLDSFQVQLFRDNSKKYKDVNVHWVLTPHILSILGVFHKLNNIGLFNTSLHTGKIISPNMEIDVSLEQPKLNKFIINNKEFHFEEDNVKSGIIYFVNCIYKLYPTNLNLSVKIVEIIDKGIKNNG